MPDEIENSSNKFDTAMPPRTQGEISVVSLGNLLAKDCADGDPLLFFVTAIKLKQEIPPLLIPKWDRFVLPFDGLDSQPTAYTIFWVICETLG